MRCFRSTTDFPEPVGHSKHILSLCWCMIRDFPAFPYHLISLERKGAAISRYSNQRESSAPLPQRTPSTYPQISSDITTCLSFLPVKPGAHYGARRREVQLLSGNEDHEGTSAQGPHALLKRTALVT